MTSRRESTVRDANLSARLRREFKESPAKAILLALGALVALFVWTPRLLPAARDGAAVSSVPDSTFGVDRDDESLLTFTQNDSLAIRRNFVAISEEAILVRRFADPWPGTRSHRDPFAPSPTSSPAAATAVPPPPLPAVPAIPDDEVEAAAGAEAERAAALRLTGIIGSSTKARALIGGRSVTVGEVVGGFLVERIADRTVVLRGDHGAYERHLRQPLAPDEPRNEKEPR